MLWFCTTARVALKVFPTRAGVKSVARGQSDHGSGRGCSILSVGSAKLARMDRFQVSLLPVRRGGSRHDHMLRRYSRDPMLIIRHRHIGVDRTTARELIEQVAIEAGAPPPEVTFHGGRGPHTGYCRPPRDRAIASTDERSVLMWEANEGLWPEHGMIRLGDPTSLGTIAHEVGHHYVHVFEPVGTAPHGKAWVSHFDDATAQIAALVRIPG